MSKGKNKRIRYRKKFLIKENNFEKSMLVYKNKCFLVRNLYWDRIKTALEFAQIKNNYTLLDIGCNGGHLLNAIQKSNKNCECWGIDIDPEIMTLQIQNCKFRIANAKNLPFQNNQFDIIFALSILEHIQDLDDVIKEIFRVLKLGGFFILSSPTETWFYRFCRFVLFGQNKDVQIRKTDTRREADHHYHNVCDIEKKVKEYGFIQIQQKSLPNFPVPELHRVIKFQTKGDS